MLRKKITIVFLPDASNRVRQLKIPQSFLLGSLLVILLFALVLTWGFMDYRSIKAKVPRLAQLVDENARQKTQLAALTNKIDRINGKLIELNEFDQKLKIHSLMTKTSILFSMNQIKFCHSSFCLNYES